MEIPGYIIEKEIGKGGMARVYLALHQALDRYVAIKVMNRQQGDDSEFSERFMREARIVASLSHPNIVTIYDVGEHDGHYYIVMELLPHAETLSDKIKEGIDRKSALRIVKQVATALHVAHGKNIVHRDIKPDNIMFRNDGSAVLMDFGIARSVDSNATNMTQTGIVIGTPHYMSPEQAQGQEIGPYSDIYSLGVVFYEMLMGKAPYQADTPLAVALKHISQPIPSFVGKLTEYQPILNRMMAKTRKDRYETCNHIIEDIDSVGKGELASHATIISNTVATNEELKTLVIGQTERSGEKKSSAKIVVGAVITAIIVVLLAVFFGTDIGRPAEVRMPVSTVVTAPVNTVVTMIKTRVNESDNIKREATDALVDSKAILIVESMPTGAQLYLDGVLIGKTPFNGDNLPAGEHQLTVTYENSNDETDDLMLVNDEILKREYQLNPATGNVSLFSKPQGADISIDGKATGKQTPVTMKHLRAGEHKITLNKNAYYPKVATLIVRKDKTVRENYTLEGGDLVMYHGKWLAPKAKQRLIELAAAKADAKMKANEKAKAKRLAKKRLAMLTMLNNKVGKMIHIPSGSFQMGSKAGGSDEKPVHEVMIKAFKLNEAEVTQAQWQAVMGENPSKFKCEHCPVEQVSWNDIQAFLVSLNQQTHQRFRLPTEAEWEYTCRSGGGNEKYCGGANETDLAWFAENSIEKTHVVKQKQANGLGLYDMSGNVWEWVQDCYQSSYEGAPSDGSVWGESACSKHVVRGGSWINQKKFLRASFRNRYGATKRFLNIGFRLAQD